METRKDRDLVSIIAMLGRRTRALFVSDRSKKESPRRVHEQSFGVVYANPIAETEIGNDKPRFAEGAVIVRERRLTPDADRPDSLIAMIKRERGFSRKTGDWEFVSFDGDLRVTKRETTGTCAACHARREETDWLYRGYLKK